MECFLCERDATRECERCGALYCDDCGNTLCERCADPDLALPSHRLYRGALLALAAGSLFALWLLIRPPGDEPGLATSPVSPVVGPATIVLVPDPTEAPTPTATEPPATAAPYIEYTVEPGDTLVAIVSRFRPDGADFEDFAARIIDINDIDDPGSLSVGQVLLIPDE